MLSTRTELFVVGALIAYLAFGPHLQALRELLSTSVGKAAAVLEVRVELANTPPKADASRLRSKRQVSPGLNTPQAPAAKREMVEDSEEEEEDGTDADIRRWMEAEHMESEFAEDGDHHSMRRRRAGH